MRRREVLRDARSPAHGLAQSDLTLSRDLPGHDRLGHGDFARGTLDLAGGEHQRTASTHSRLERAAGSLAAGADSLATPAGMDHPGSGPRDATATHLRAGWLRWAAFSLACLVLAALILAGLRRVNEGHTELTGQALPPPVALHAGGNRLDLRFYNLQARVNLPAAALRDAAAAVRSFGGASRVGSSADWPRYVRPPASSRAGSCARPETDPTPSPSPTRDTSPSA